MLVLSRKKEQRVGCRITQAEAEEIFASGCGEIQIDVLVIEIREDKIRLGFQAPKPVRVNREEVWAKIDQKTETGETVAAGVEDLAEITKRAF